MADDLMFQDEIREVVRGTYGSLPAGAGRAMAGRLYEDEQLASVPDEAVAWSLGVGNPVRHAGLQPGDAVVDLGCGGGIDSVLAAHRVGHTGRVTGVDTLEEMCVAMGERIPFSIDDCAIYPLFDDDVIALMKRLIPERDQARIATSVIVHARKPEHADDAPRVRRPGNGWVRPSSSRGAAPKGPPR